MKYKYYEKDHERLIAESNSPIQFNAARFPRWKSIIPVIEEDKVEAVVEKVTEEVTEEVAERKPYVRKKKKIEEDNN